jgi:hypothetical protein
VYPVPGYAGTMVGAETPVIDTDSTVHVEKTKIVYLVNNLYYESINRDLKTRPVYECRCDERLKTKAEESTRLVYTGFCLLLIEKARV